MRRYWIVLLGLGLACEAKTPPALSDPDTKGTSADVAENAQPLLDAARAWRVDTNAVLTIGAGDPRAVAGDSVYEFNDIVGAQFLGDGRIVVAVMGAYVLRYFDAAGTFHSAAGRRGDGPGEFRQILKLFRMRGDTLAVDDNHVELDWFDPNGKVITSGRARRRGQVPLQPVVLLEGGTYFGVKATGFEVGTRFRQRQIGLVRVRPGRDTPDTVAVMPGILETRHAPGVAPRMVVFSPQLLLAALGDSLVTASSAAYELQIRGEDGVIGRRIRRAAPGTPVDTRLKEAYGAYLLTRLNERGEPFPPRWRQQQERFLAQNPFVDTLPRIQAIVVSRDSDIWVAHYSPQTEFRQNWSVGTQWIDEPMVWDVFDRSGRWRTSVSLPARFTLLDAFGDRILGLVANDMGEQGVRVLRLIKP